MGPACDDVCLHGVPDEENTECICSQTCWNSTGCNIECSEHGSCDENGDCVCDYLLGYSGTYCEVPGMLVGIRVGVGVVVRYWNSTGCDIECSDHGSCDMNSDFG